MQHTEEHLGLARELLTVILGLDQVTLDRVINVIEESPDISDMKTARIRMRIGPRSMVYLRNAIEQARSEGSEKHEHGTEEEPDQFDKDISGDIVHKDQPEEESGMDISAEDEQKMSESMISFKDYLTEVSMDVDLSDPIVAQREIKHAARMAKTSPQRLGQQQRLKAKANVAAAKAEEGPTANLKKQIAQLQQRLAQLQMRLAQQERASGGQEGASGGQEGAY